MLSFDWTIFGGRKAQFLLRFQGTVCTGICICIDSISFCNYVLQASSHLPPGLPRRISTNACSVRIWRRKYSEKKAVGATLTEYLHYWFKLDLLWQQLYLISCSWKSGKNICFLLITFRHQWTTGTFDYLPTIKCPQKKLCLLEFLSLISTVWQLSLCHWPWSFWLFIYSTEDHLRQQRLQSPFSSRTTKRL